MIRWFQVARISAVCIVLLPAILLPSGTVEAQVTNVGNETSGPSSLAGPSSSPNSPEALATVDLSTGSVRTGFAFDLPKARGDAQPALGLSYASSTSTGFAGAGWTLTTPAIMRKGIAGVPRFEDPAITSPTTLSTNYQADDYYINGQLLVAICTINDGTCINGSMAPNERVPTELAGATMSGWTYFRAQVDDGSRYFLSATGQTWIEQTKPGRVRVYGLPLDNAFTSGAEHPTPSTLTAVNYASGFSSGPSGTSDPVYRWNLVRDMDAIGNTVYYEWTNNADLLATAGYTGPSSELFLADIYDTPSVASGAGSSPLGGQPSVPSESAFAHHIHLTWELAHPEKPVVLSTGFWHATPFAELQEVDVTSAQWGTVGSRQLVRAYELGYTSNAPWNTMSYLQTVTLVGACGATEGSNGALPHPLPCAQSDSRLLRTYAYSGDATADDAGKPIIQQTITVAQPHWGPSSSSVVAFPSALLDVNGDSIADLVFGPVNDAGKAPPNTGPFWLQTVFGPLPTTAAGTPDRTGMSAGNPPTLVANIRDDLFPNAPKLVYGDWLSNGQLNWLWMNLPAGKSLFPTYEAYTELQTHPAILYASNPSGLPLDLTRDVVPGTLPNWTAVNALDVDGDGLTDEALYPDPSSTAAPPPLWTSVTTRDREGNTYPFSFQVGTGAPYPAMNPAVNAINAFDYLSTWGDMNGDGLIDVVLLYHDITSVSAPVWFHVFLNDGDGTYTDVGDTQTLSANPVFENVAGGGSGGVLSQSSVAIADLNGDGISDFALFDGFANLNVCLLSGTFTAGTFECTAIPISKLGFEFVNAGCEPLSSTIQSADIDGTGIPHVVLFSGCKHDVGANSDIQTAYAALSVAPNADATASPRPPRPGLLTSVTAIGGRTTTFTYGALTDPSLKSSTVPVPVWVATSMTDTNGLTGNVARTTTVDYDYQTPLYDPREREFVGFREIAETETSSDPGAPGLYRFTRYLTDTCLGSALGVSCTDRPDYSYFHATRGLPATIEESDLTSGNRLRTTVNQYSFDSQYASPMDARIAMRRWVQQADVYLWDSQTAVLRTIYPIEQFQGLVSLSIELPVTSGSCAGRTTGGPCTASGTDLRRTSDRDAFGNEVEATDFGNYSVDRAILTSRTWALPPGDVTGWSYRPTSTTVQYAGGAAARSYSYTYYANGLLDTVSATLSGTLPLSRNAVNGGPAPTPADAAPVGSQTVLLGKISYDSFGNIQTMQAPNNRCTGFVYDSTFGEFAQTRNDYPGGCNSGAPLTTTYRFDLGFGVQTLLLTPAQELSLRSYDEFGRLTTVFQPSDLVPDTTDLEPALEITYTASATCSQCNDTGPTRITRYQTVDGADQSAFLVDHYQYVDGFGDVLASLGAAGNPGDSQLSWIVSGAHYLYSNGLMRSAFKPFYITGVATAFTPGTYGAPESDRTYDAIGRVLSSTDYLGGKTTWLYHPASLSVDIRDPEQTNTGPNSTGTHTKAFTTVTMNGHGERVGVDQHYGKGPLGQSGDLTTTIQYLPTGEPNVVYRTGGGKSYLRTMAYDTLGHMVFNSEPNTNDGGAGGWTYAYNLNGELVGTSDARGCGENIVHDALGRVLSEDYSPCTALQPAYSMPSASGDGTEVFNVYDPATGRLTDTYDRAQHTQAFYDARGRVSTLSRSIARPDAPTALAGRYTPRVFTKQIGYLESNRLLSETTGADPSVPDLLGAGGVSSVSYSYFLQGVLKGAGGSYGPLVTTQSVDALGLPLTQTLGDIAGTTITSGYDANETRTAYAVTRPSPGPWVAPNTYANNPPTSPQDDCAAFNCTFQQQLANIALVPDGVGNPVTATDSSPGSPWPTGSQPAAYTYTYSDDYRLTGLRATYGGAGSTDGFVAPYVAGEIATGSATFPAPQPVSTHERVNRQTFSYDWLGNTHTTTDDAADFPDRSLGTIVNGAPGYGTNQLSSATEGARGIRATYDKAGNLAGWVTIVPETVNGQTTERVENEYVYLWDEVGRLMTAYWTSPATAQDSLVVDQFTYTGTGHRVATARQVWNEEVKSLGDPAYTIRVFGSLMLSGATFGASSPTEIGDYEVDDKTEQLYLPSAHVIYDQEQALPSAGGWLHVFFTVGDPLGSTSFVIDQGTGEMIERPTYQVYGQVDTDYRPARWGSFRELVRYTSHEDDAEIGLAYFGARYYATQLGRWISPDPLTIHGLSGDLNPYAFVRGSPAGNVDPFGLDDEDDMAAEDEQGSLDESQVSDSANLGALSSGQGFGTQSFPSTTIDSGCAPGSVACYQTSDPNGWTTLSVFTNAQNTQSLSVSSFGSQDSPVVSSPWSPSGATRVGPGAGPLPSLLAHGGISQSAPNPFEQCDEGGNCTYTLYIPVPDGFSLMAAWAGLQGWLGLTATAPQAVGAARATQIGETVGAAVRGQATGKMAQIASLVTRQYLVQSDAATAVAAAVRTIGLRSATVVVGGNVVVASVLPGADRNVLVVQAGGAVVQGLADLTVQGVQFVVTNVRF